MTRVVCFGGATLDRLYRAAGPVRAGTSNPVAREEEFGGVARNVAVNLARLGVATSLVSIVGDDASGAALRRDLETLGIDVRGVAVSPRHATAEYIAVFGPDRELAFGMADMAIFDELSAEHVASFVPETDSPWLFADCNLPAAALAALLARNAEPRSKIAVDAVSVAKIERLPKHLVEIDLLFLNADEGASFLGRTGLDPVTTAAQLLERGVGGVILTLGADGLLVGEPGGPVRHIPALPAAVVDVTGAGDALVAATLWRLVAGDTLFAAAHVGRLAAALTVAHPGSTRPDLSPTLLDAVADRVTDHPSAPSSPTAGP